MDALAPTADEGRSNLRKAEGSRKQAKSLGYPNGETRQPKRLSPCHESIVTQEGTPGSETSKYREEKKENSIPSVVASEQGRGQTERLRSLGVEGCQREAESDLNTEGKRDRRR